MAEWRYIVERLNGDGTSSLIASDAPLRSPEITRVLSGPWGLNATLTPEWEGMQDETGKPLLKKWSSCIWAVQDRVIRGGGIVTDLSKNGPSLSVTCTGFTAYPAGMPWIGEDQYAGVQVDPLDVVRVIWTHLQAQRMGNLGLQVSGLKTGLKIGTVLQQVEFDSQAGPISFESGPVVLAEWNGVDLGAKIDDLAKDTPFDYAEDHILSADFTSIQHKLNFGYPTIGRRRHDLRFVVGENVAVPYDEKETGSDFANEVLVLGAGEGRSMIRGYGHRDDGALRRVAVITDKQRRSKRDANALAAQEIAKRLGLGDIAQVAVRESDNAPLGSWTEGDEICLESDGEWGGTSLWVRVLSTTINPQSGDVATLSVARAESVAK